ncbi:hypothetical protein Ae201684P_021971 [Aphanomyces euteiches]|nr:hypothetical protein Ae201684P_021971 [Aphanomyces euteiches]
MSQQASPPDQASDPALRRVIVDLSDPVGAPPREIHPKRTRTSQEKSYADLLKGDQDNAPPKRVKTVVNRPKPEYLSKLIDLASQEDANEEDVLEAISQATPIQVKKATTTMWIETMEPSTTRSTPTRKSSTQSSRKIKMPPGRISYWSSFSSTKRASATSSCPLPRVT